MGTLVGTLVLVIGVGLICFLIVNGNFEDAQARQKTIDDARGGYGPARTANAPSIAERLRELDNLKVQGLVTKSEHQARRAKILEDM